MLDRTTTRVLSVVLGAYLVLALVGRSTATGEVFPLFAFDLFTRLPERVATGTDVWLHAVDGEAFEEPVPLRSSGLARGSVEAVSNVTRSLADAVAGRGDGDVDAIAQRLVTNHLPPGAVEWSLVLVSTDLYRAPGVPVEHWELRRFLGSEPQLSGWAIGRDEVRTPDGARPLREGRGGVLEQVDTLADGRLFVGGWSALAEEGEPRALVIVQGDEVVAVGAASIPRGDVADLLGLDGRLFAGFQIAVATTSDEVPTVIAIFDDHARVLEPSARLTADGDS